MGYISGRLVTRDITSGAVVRELVGHTSIVFALVALPGPEPRLLASGSYDRSVRVWRVDTGECIAMLLGHQREVSSLAVLRDGRLASGSADRSVRLWDVGTRTCTATLAHTSIVISLAALPDGGVAVGCDDGAIALWSSDPVPERTGTLNIGDLRKLLPDGACSLLVLPDGRLAAGYGDCRVRVWDVAARVRDAVLEGHTNAVWSLAVLPDGRLLSGSWDRTIKVWDKRALGVRGLGATSVCAATLVGHTDNVMALALLRDGTGRVASGSLDGTIRFWA